MLLGLSCLLLYIAIVMGSYWDEDYFTVKEHIGLRAIIILCACLHISGLLVNL